MRIAAAAMLLLLLLLNAGSAYGPYNPRAVASNDWHDALVYLREHISEEASVMAWWDYGYWILDLAERRPVVDNGNHPGQIDRDVALAYCTTEALEAVRIMQKYEASYLIFAKQDMAILPSISEYGLGKAYGDGHSIPEELENSLYSRVLSDDFQSEQGLEVVYRNEEVVILSLGR